ncbi:plasmolipin-like isoform X1 [Macrobrachium rosenbergii]|uniref:plasmolipin-like isoform X1 n=2 Tax=Macrobrachium rosenbergii TaxID=79674 RepID=UPI0034D3B036
MIGSLHFWFLRAHSVNTVADTTLPESGPGLCNSEMSDFPASHTTTTAAPAPEAHNERKIYVNTGYLRSDEGKLKCAHLAICILVFILVMASQHPRSNQANWISFVSMGGFWTSAFLLFLYVINVVGFLSVIPWLFLELCYTVIWTFFWFVAGCVGGDFAARYMNGELFAAAAFFSFIAMCLYGFNAYLNFTKWRSGGATLPFMRRWDTSATTTTTTRTTTTTTATTQKY